ncbi:hypothetical protein JCM3774_001197 [Rhodotorula dairenensis]
MGVCTPHKPQASKKKTTSASAPAPRLEIMVKSSLCVERSHEIGRFFRNSMNDMIQCPPSGNKVRDVKELASFTITGSTFAFDQVAGGVYCAAVGEDRKLTGEEWAVTWRAEESLLPRQLRTGMKRSRVEEESDDDAASEREDAAAEDQGQVKAASSTSRHRKSEGERPLAKKSRSAPAAPKKKPRRGASSRRHGHEREHDEHSDDDAKQDDGDATETEASHLARAHQRQEGDQVLVPSTLGGSSPAGSNANDAASPEGERSDGETSLGRGKRITGGLYGRARKSKSTSGRDKTTTPPATAPRPKQRGTVLADPMNAYNHEFETPAFQGRRNERRAMSVTGDSEVARLCARVDDLGVRSVTGSAAASVTDTDTVRGSPAPEADPKHSASSSASASASTSAAMTRSASKGKGRAQ